MEEEASGLRPLFGGMIAMRVPAHMVDISTVRHVPDHQECFADASGQGKNVDRSLIVEIVEYEEKLRALEDRDHALFYFKDLAQANEAFSFKIDQVETGVLGRLAHPLTPKSKVNLVFGTQQVSKYREGAEASNEVLVCLGHICLPEYETEILVTLNSPLSISRASSSFNYTQQGHEDGDEDPGATAHRTQNLFRDLLRSFQVKDYKLFGHG